MVPVMVSGRERDKMLLETELETKPGKANLRHQDSFCLSLIICLPQLILTPSFAKRQFWTLDNVKKSQNTNHNKDSTQFWKFLSYYGSI